MSVTLQINCAPTDEPTARHTLPHLLRAVGDQVDEVLLTYDSEAPAGGGRFSEAWEERRPAMDALLERLCDEHPHARVGVVDTAPATRRAVARALLRDAEDVPLKDARGGPMYSYFHGLHEASHDLVLHADSDMLLGGGSRTWVAEAAGLLAAHDDLLFAGPLPGPPRADGVLLDNPGGRPAPELGVGAAFRFATVSTRVFLLDRRRLTGRVGGVALRPPLLWRSRLKARLRGRAGASAMPEQLWSLAMAEHGLSRIDFLGSDPGLWSLHPPFRSPEFFAALPGLVERVEAGDLPESQRGRYDVVDELVDWTSARQAARRNRLRLR
jgi:hypothetical protein